MNPETLQILFALAGAALGWIARHRTMPQLSEVEKAILDVLKPKLAAKRAAETHEAIEALVTTKLPAV